MEDKKYDVVLIGAGIMSATLGALLHELDPKLTIGVLERLEEVSKESSDSWNNAGTGHSAFCELNYTPRKDDGTISIEKAVKIAEAFEVSKQFWAYLAGSGRFPFPQQFIHQIPHISVVWGKEDVKFLKDRHEAMSRNPLFAGMEFTKQKSELRKWLPLMMQQRKGGETMAATRMQIGTDVNFGLLTRNIFDYLEKESQISIHLNSEVTDLIREEKGWNITVEGKGGRTIVQSSFVFIGAGGGALRLLEKSGIEEAEGYAGFPISGQWLVCKNESVIAQHHAKAYGKAAIGAPPMSVPHLDTRIINGRTELLFGPFAGFTTRFLKEGSLLDLAKSITTKNVIPLLGAGFHNLSLTQYLINQLSLSFNDKMDVLRQFVPQAENEDWELAIAGQRVQVIKKDDEEGGVLEFGTEVVAAADGSLTALLGASPGASTSVAIMLELLQRAFPERMKSTQWQRKLLQMIPTYGKKFSLDETLTHQIRKQSHEKLGLPILT